MHTRKCHALSEFAKRNRVSLTCFGDKSTRLTWKRAPLAPEIKPSACKGYDDERTSSSASFNLDNKPNEKASKRAAGGGGQGGRHAKDTGKGL